MENEKSLNEYENENKAKIIGGVVIGQPFFETKTPMVIVRDQISVASTEEDDDKGKFNAVFWRVTMSANVDGAAREFTQNVKGLKLRKYEDEDGEPIVLLDCTKMSMAGKTFAVMKECNIDWDGDIKTLQGTLVGLTGKVKSEEWSVAGKKGHHNYIVDLNPRVNTAPKKKKEPVKVEESASDAEDLI